MTKFLTARLFSFRSSPLALLTLCTALQGCLLFEPIEVNRGDFSTNLDVVEDTDLESIDGGTESIDGGADATFVDCEAYFGAAMVDVPAEFGDILSGSERTDGPLPGRFYNVYAMPLTAGQTVSIRMSASDAGFDTYLSLYDSFSCSEVAFDDDGAGIAQDSLLTYTASNTDIYYLFATAYARDATGIYTLTVD